MSTTDLGRCGRYDLLEPLGAGGMGCVYRGWDPELGRAVAIKVINGWEPSEESLARFRREAQALAALSHPNIVAVYDVSMAGDDPFIVMELVDGRSLDSVIAARSVTSFETKVRTIAQVCDALAHAHQAGIVHRDVKPANVLITSGGLPKLADFGIARLNDSTLTAGVLGSPAYLAPESCAPGETDARVDVYGAAACLYEWLCGTRPFEADSVPVLLAQIREQDPTPLSDRWVDCPPSLERCVHKGLARNRDVRYPGAGDFALALREIVGDHRAAPQPPAVALVPQRAPRSRRALAGAVALIMAAILLAWLPGPWRRSAVPSAPASTAAIVPPPSATPRPAPKLETRSAPTGTGTRPVRDPAGRVPAASAVVPAAAETGQDTGDIEPAPPPALSIGTTLRVRLLTELSSDRAQPGHGFDAALAEPLLFNGAVLAAAGTSIKGLVDEVNAGGGDRPPSLRLSLTDITLRGKPARIRTERYDVIAPSGGSAGGSIKTLILGAVAAAIVGRGGTNAAAGAPGSPPDREETRPGTVVLRHALTFKLAAPLLVGDHPQ